eukprot:CFRG5762T1
MPNLSTSAVEQPWAEPQIPDNEELRLSVIEEYGFGVPPEENLCVFVKSLARTLATLTQCKIVVLSIVKKEKQQFYSRVGLKASETPRSVSFCAHAINRPDKPLVVLNALEDDRFSMNPLVRGPPDIRFYHGVPLVSSEGTALGTLCAIHDQPSRLMAGQEEALNLFAKFCVCQLELVRAFRLSHSEHIGDKKKRRKVVKHVERTLGPFLHFLPTTNPLINDLIISSCGKYSELVHLMTDTTGSMLLFFQLGKEESLEILMFWQICEIYRSSPCVEFLIGAVDSFLQSEAAFEINLGVRYKPIILNVFETVKSLLAENTSSSYDQATSLCIPDILDKVQLDLMIGIYNNAFLRLSKEKAYTDYVDLKHKKSKASILDMVGSFSPFSVFTDKQDKRALTLDSHSSLKLNGSFKSTTSVLSGKLRDTVKSL